MDCGKKNMEKIIEKIKCPECGTAQHATVDNATTPFATLIHECICCGYIILESEWEKIN